MANEGTDRPESGSGHVTEHATVEHHHVEEHATLYSRLPEASSTFSLNCSAVAVARSRAAAASAFS